MGNKNFSKKKGGVFLKMDSGFYSGNATTSTAQTRKQLQLNWIINHVEK
jgi:hypothetical protein